MTAGLEHTCALRDGGGAYCWGYNASGRLGLGFASNTNVTAPTQVVMP
jgi:alpha-tubulin suppressor-like RCC1 family protein